MIDTNDDPRLAAWQSDRTVIDIKRMLTITEKAQKARRWALLAQGRWSHDDHDDNYIWRDFPSGVRLAGWTATDEPLFALVNPRGRDIAVDRHIPVVAFTQDEVEEFTGTRRFYLPGCAPQAPTDPDDLPWPLQGPADRDALKPLIAVLRRRLRPKTGGKARRRV